MNNSNDTREDVGAALRALRDRGIDDAESIIISADTQTILRTCKWWDGQRREKKTSGLLVWKIRQGGVSPADVPVTKTAVLRETFDTYVAAHPVGSRLCSHRALAARKWPDEEENCDGNLMVVVAAYPVLEMECDRCGFDAALTPRAMKEALA